MPQRWPERTPKGSDTCQATTRSRYLALTDRERAVVELMAQGRSNGAISRQLFLTLKTVEGHIASIFTKLDLHSEPDDNRRVLAVLGWLESS
jgi:DNA-binding NarL/FixJ family response regulator